MNRKLIALLTCLALITPGFLPVGLQAPLAMAQTPPAESNPPQEVNQGQSAPRRHYYQPSRERRSYERETHKRHHRITKEEVIFLVAVAGTPMGIGAIAGGARGLAIGSIVGGWAAFGAHHLWKHLH